MRVLTSVVLSATVLFGCGGPAETKPDAGTPGGGVRALALTVTPDTTEAPIQSQVRVTAVVSVANALAADLSGQVVTFHVVKGGGSVFAGAATTNAAGEAREVWTLGTSAGDQEIEVRAVDQATGEPLVYAKLTAKALPGPAASWSLTPDRVDLQAGEAWDYSTASVAGFDQYSNRVEVAQAFTLRAVMYEGASVDPIPSCTTEGTRILCPKVAGQPRTVYRAYFDSPYREFSTAIVIN